MSKKIFCSIPDACLDPDLPVAAQVRSQLREALALKIEPSSIPRSTRSQAVLIDEPELSEVLAISLRRGVAPGKVVGGLMYAQHLGGVQRRGEACPQYRIAEPVMEGLRSGQMRVLQQAAPLLLAGKIVFSECGTGTGKARLIAHAAAYLLDVRDQGRLPRLPDVDAITGAPLPEYLKEHVREVVAAHKSRVQDLIDDQRPASVLICAPSIENVAHLVAEWFAVRPVIDPNGLRKAAVRLGRGQFVNPSALQSLLDEADPAGLSHPRTRAWMQEMLPGRTAATRALSAIEPGLRGLLVDLMSVANEDMQSGESWIDVKACGLSNDDVLDDEDDSENYTDHLRRYADGFDVLFTTTAMLCLDNLTLRDSGAACLLPSTVAGILIDEAHLLESVQANLASRGLSLSRMVADLKKLKSVVAGAHAEKALEKVLAVRHWLSALPHDANLPPGEADADHRQAWDASAVLLREAGKDIGMLIKSRTKAGLDAAATKAMRSIQAAAAVIGYALGSGDRQVHGVLHHSPVKGYISMTFGPAEVSRHLMARWAVTPCALLFSGTLFHMSASGTSAKGAASAVGAVSRYAQTDALHPSWLFKPVEVHQPSLDNFHMFIPPKREDATDAAMRGWLESVAKVIARASADAAGGMLVLMTGYQRLSILEGLLRAALEPSDFERLIIQTPHASTSVLADEFRSRSRKGMRPIWLGTGSAWTGLDLSDRDVPPSQDFLLTDLVIPAAPFGLERSTTHMARLRKMGFKTELMGVQQKLRQGFGRLVRREGVVNRRIWLLDGRLVNPASAQRFADIRRAVAPYLRRASIE